MERWIPKWPQINEESTLIDGRPLSLAINRNIDSYRQAREAWADINGREGETDVGRQEMARFIIRQKKGMKKEGVAETNRSRRLLKIVEVEIEFDY